jgi:hypothetical protein
MSSGVSGSESKDKADGIIELLDQPVLESLCPQSKAAGEKRRFPVCPFIMLSVIAAVGLLAYFAFPNQSDANLPWQTRVIDLPYQAGTVRHRDRAMNPFYGGFERQLEIDGALNRGVVWLPSTSGGGSTHGNFVWHGTGSNDAGNGPWLELNDRTGDFLIDLRDITIYRIFGIDGRLCALPFNKHEYDVSIDDTRDGCAKVWGRSGPTVDIADLSENWTTEHMGLLDRRPRFIPGEAIKPPENMEFYLSREKIRLDSSFATGPKPCPPPPRRHGNRGPPARSGKDKAAKFQKERCRDQAL